MIILKISPIYPPLLPFSQPLPTHAQVFTTLLPISMDYAYKCISSLVSLFFSLQPHIKVCQSSSFFRSGINSLSHYLRNTRESGSGVEGRCLVLEGRRRYKSTAETSGHGVSWVRLSVAGLVWVEWKRMVLLHFGVGLVEENGIGFGWSWVELPCHEFELSQVELCQNGLGWVEWCGVGLVWADWVERSRAGLIWVEFRVIEVDWVELN